MKSLAASIQAFAIAIGGPGLFLIGFLDSSVLSLPEINDLLVIWMVTQHKHLMVYYATMATLGSMSGCFLLYYLGRKGGETFLRKRFHARHVDRALGVYERYGLLAVLVPAILPPPAPFKIFVLMAGVARVRVATFTIAIGVGRGFRYFAEGLLAVWYGDLAVQFLRDNGRHVSIAIAIVVLVGGVAYFIWKRRHAGAPDGIEAGVSNTDRAAGSERPGL